MYRAGSTLSGSVQTEPEDLSSQGPGGGGGREKVVPTGGVWDWRGRSNRFLMFCDIVLKHTNYPSAFGGSLPSSKASKSGRERIPREEEEDNSEDDSVAVGGSLLPKSPRVSDSPLNSVGESARESTRSSTSSSTDSVLLGDEIGEDVVDKETFESVSCWCGKPFAGRPMIECDKCLVWFHMSCEAVRRNNIPHLFVCSQCRDKRKRRNTEGSSVSSTVAGESRRKSGKLKRKSLGAPPGGGASDTFDKSGPGHERLKESPQKKKKMALGGYQLTSDAADDSAMGFEPLPPLTASFSPSKKKSYKNLTPLPPPKLQPQEELRLQSGSKSSSAASPPPPPLLLSSNFVVDHQIPPGGTGGGSSAMIGDFRLQTSVIVGGGPQFGDNLASQ